ncbi:MAG: GNAT family N-acetyltransferase [Alphaproteobacteria bacterium]|nr:GNAT family N-acetyltransferase [Alphaproteobacteria bacterium]
MEKAGATRIETERLILAPLDRSWRQDLTRLHHDPVVAHWLFPKGAPSAADEDKRIDHYEELWKARGYGCFAVIDKVSGAFLGRTGPVVTPETGRVEIVWSLMSTVHSRGLATEAAIATIGFTLDHSNLDLLDCYVRPDNTASQRVAAKAGFSLVDQRVLYDMNLNYYTLARARLGTG